MQLTENLICVSHEDSVITYSRVMHIVKYIRETEIQVFWNMTVSLDKWFPVFCRVVVLLSLGLSSPRIAKFVEMCGVT